MIVMMVAREQAARHMMGILTSSKFFVKGLSIPPPPPQSQEQPKSALEGKQRGLSPLGNLANSWAPLAACLVPNGCQRPRVLWDFGT